MELLEEGGDKDTGSMGGGGVYPRLSHDKAGNLVGTGAKPGPLDPRTRYTDHPIAAFDSFIPRHDLVG